jgi:alkaline phosphatase D
MTSLADYRLRHANYKSDVDLQAAHRQHPWICTWDDHESTNDSHTTGAQNHTEGSEGVWSNRKRFSIQAYFEWMPVREAFNPLTHPDQHLYRRLRYGNLLDIFVLDTRLEGRDPPPANAAAASEANRRIMSNTQEQWLLNGLVSSTATWKLVAQQTMIGLLYTTPGNSFTLDAWDGYLAQRARLLDFIGGQNPSGQPIQNVVVITGDIHTAFATEVTKTPTDTTAYVPGLRGSVAVEFVCPSITSVGFPEVRALQQTNRHLRYAEASGDGGHGYNVLDITPQRCQSEWFFNATVLQPSDIERAGLMSVWKADAGVPYLSQGTASVPVANPPAAAP